jgi:guanylate kinase
VFSVTEELEKLRLYREKVSENNEAYLLQHPELRSIVDDFVTAIVQQKPNDLIKFGAFYFTDKQKNGMIGPCPVVIAGPSGVGKGTIIQKLLEQFPNSFGFSVSHTTRDPRPGEENGIHYNFVTKGEFEEAMERGEFVEFAKVHLNFYGTSFNAIDKVC